MPSLGVVIPAYNAERKIAWVIDRIPAETWTVIDTVWIIENGSEDATASVVEDLRAKHPKISVHSFMPNRGYGGAVRKGLELCRQAGSDYVCCLHADGQYPPEMMYEFVQHMHQNQIDILQGSRHKNGTALQGGMPLYKYVAGKILVRLENFTFGLKMTDYHSGYMFYSRKAVETLPFDRLSDSFEFDLEVIASAHLASLRISELSIPTYYGDEKSHIDLIPHGFRVLHLLARYLTGSYQHR